jgi:hypothetical protein
MPVNMRISLILFALASLSVVASSAADKTSERIELQANRAKWEQHRITSYEFRLRDDDCFCLHALGYGPFHVLVRKGRVARAIYEGETRDGYWPGRVISKKLYEKTILIATVEEIFARAERIISLADRPHKIRYDSEYGFPTLIDVDNPPGWADAQWRLVVYAFRPRKS